MEGIKQMSLEELNSRAEILKRLCHELDPYAPINEEDTKALHAMGITQTDDPFHLTNILILYVEDTLEEISKRKTIH
jgi:phage terminase large subunit-like protein